MRRKAIIGGVISLLFLYLAFRRVDFDRLWIVLQSVRWPYLIPNIVMVVGVMWLRAWRWQGILKPVGKARYQRVYSSTMIGFMVNNVLPARLGEIARAVSLAKTTGLSRSAVLATIIVERIYDSFTLLLFLWMVFLFSRISQLTEVGRIREVGWVFLAINVALLGILVVMQVRNELVVRAVRRLSRFFSARVQQVATEITEKFARGLTMHHDWPTTAGVSILSIIIWLCLALSNYFVFLAFGFNHLPIEASFVVLVVVSLMISIPSTAGFVGVYHWATQISLQIYGLDKTQAVAVAVVLHAAQYIPITLLGFYWLRREHLRLSTVGGGKAPPETPDSGPGG
ncbi:MAG: flippase-like domain-containing protein [candidate division Zixibacteria bacterium]|nr:flippase-like domain-containing protein [candidate division Zixibacteria bacterium]